MTTKPPDLSEFGGALAASIECMCEHYTGDPRLLAWTIEILNEGIEVHGLTQIQADQLRSITWEGLKTTTQETLQRLRQQREIAS